MKKNLFQNGDFKDAMRDWSLQTVSTLDSNNWVTGTLSAGAAGFTQSLSTTAEALEGRSSGKWSKGAANYQRQGFQSEVLQVDKELQGNVCKFEFAYKLTQDSGTLVLGGVVTTHDIKIAVYDITNSSWIQPSGHMAINSIGIATMATGEFQVPINTAQVKIFIFQATTSTAAWTLVADQFQLGKGFRSYDSLGLTPVVTKYTSGSGTHTRNPAAIYLRVRMVGGGGGGMGGGNISGSLGGGAGGNTTFGTLTANGGAGGSTGLVSGGSGSIGSGFSGSIFQGASGTFHTLNGNNIGIYLMGQSGGNSPLSGAGSGSYTANGTAAAANSGSGGGGGGTNAAGIDRFGGSGGHAGGFIDAISTGAIPLTFSYSIGAGGTAGPAGTNGNAGGAGGSGYIEVTEFIPSSNVLMSSDADTRVTVASANGAGTNAMTTGTQYVLSMQNELIDTHGAQTVSGATNGTTTKSGWYYTALSPGYYQITSQISTNSAVLAANSYAAVSLRKNGSGSAGAMGIVAGDGFSKYESINGTQIIFLNAGDYVELMFETSVTTVTLANNQGSSVNVVKVQGPATIAASESVNLKYNNTAGTTIDTSNNTRHFPTKEYDSHGDSFPSPGIFTAKISGIYAFSVHMRSTTTLTASDDWKLVAYKNNSTVVALDAKAGTGAANTNNTVQINGRVALLVGETIQFNSYLALGTLTLTTSAGDNYMAIDRVGNYV